jgi:hypothetical protein
MNGSRPVMNDPAGETFLFTLIFSGNQALVAQNGFYLQNLY